MLTARFALDSCRAALYAAPYACLLGYGAQRLVGAEPRRRAALLLCAALCLSAAAAWTAAIHLNPWEQARPQRSIFHHLDDASYDRWGREIASRWRAGERPALSGEFELGSLHTGYYRLVAAVYLVVGPRPLLILALNLVACALLPIALYFLALEFSGKPVARRAAWLGALYPAFWFHSAFLMRDVWIALFFLASLAVYFDLRRHPEHPRKAQAWRLVCLCAFLAQLFLLRYYAVAFLAAAWALHELTLGQKRKRALLGALLAAVLALALRAIPQVAALEDWLVQGFTWAIPAELDTWQAGLTRFAEGLVKFFLAPFAWATKGGYTVDYFLWPGQWVLYILLLPFGLWGMAHTARRGPTDGFLLLFPFIAASFCFALAYSGSAPRQRMFLDALLIVFAALALERKSQGDGPTRRWLAIYYALFSLFVLSHIASLFIRGIW
jgi:hypothetical protein